VFGVQRLVPTFDKTWYKSLQMPSWTPPNYVFPLGAPLTEGIEAAATLA
jgi:tryptophan-rich sensory protein